jgi:hypothetical protein
MKTLKEYILESSNIVSANFILNFKDMPDGKETLNAIKDKCTSIDVNFIEADDKLTITLNSKNCNNSNINELVDDICDYATKIRKDMKNAANETFAQKTKSFKNVADNMKEYLETAKQEKEEVKDEQEKIDDKNKEENKEDE